MLFLLPCGHGSQTEEARKERKGPVKHQLAPLSARGPESQLKRLVHLRQRALSAMMDSTLTL